MFHVKHEFAFQFSTICAISESTQRLQDPSVLEPSGPNIGMAEFSRD